MGWCAKEAVSRTGGSPGRFTRSGLVCCSGLAKVAHGIDGRAVDKNFIVHVRAGGTPADADIADGVAATKLLTWQDIETRKVTVISGKTVPMVDNDEASVTRPLVRFDHDAVRG